MNLLCLFLYEKNAFIINMNHIFDGSFCVFFHLIYYDDFKINFSFLHAMLHDIELLLNPNPQEDLYSVKGHNTSSAVVKQTLD